MASTSHYSHPLTRSMTTSTAPAVVALRVLADEFRSSGHLEVAALFDAVASAVTLVGNVPVIAITKDELDSYLGQVGVPSEPALYTAWQCLSCEQVYEFNVPLAYPRLARAAAGSGSRRRAEVCIDRTLRPRQPGSPNLALRRLDAIPGLNQRLSTNLPPRARASFARST